MKITDFSTFRIETIVKVITYMVGAIGFFSIYRYIRPLYSVIFLLLFAISIYFEYKKRFSIPRWVLNVLSLSVVIFTIYTINTEELVTQIVEALLIIFAVKFLEEKKVRDYMQIYTLSLFLLAGLGLLSLDIVFSVFLLVIVIMLSTSCVLLTFYSQDNEMELTRETAVKILAKSIYIPMLAIPLTALMFVILPRTQFPIFDFLNRSDKAKTGFTDKVRLGAVSNIQEDSSVILRANMDRVSDDNLYWRGVVLDYFDGSTWSGSEREIVPASLSVLATGKSVRQVIYLEPYANRYVFVIDKPAFVSLRGIKRYDDLTFALPISIERRLRYEAVSIMSDILVEQEVDKESYLQLPDSISDDIKALAKRIISGQDRERDILALYRFFNDGQYKYSLKNLPVSQTPLEDFLFKNRYGNCEYFASAFAVMLRLAGIPARLVGGYRGGYYNDVGKYYFVPQKNAHVWVEAFIEQKGWVRIDPTPASIDNFTFIRKGNTMMRLRLMLDTINFYWYAFIINYNLDKQLSIILKLRTGFKRPRINLSLKKWEYLRYIVIILLAAGIIFITIVFIKQRKKGDRRILLMFLRKMRRYGYEKMPSQGLEEFALGIKDETIKANACLFVQQFQELYYKDRPLKKEDTKRLKDIIKKT